jgi:hypothetical protein
MTVRKQQQVEKAKAAANHQTEKRKRNTEEAAANGGEAVMPLQLVGSLKSDLGILRWRSNGSSVNYYNTAESQVYWWDNSRQQWSKQSETKSWFEKLPIVPLL